MPKHQKGQKDLFNNVTVTTFELGLIDFLVTPINSVATVDDFEYEQQYKVLICRKHNRL